MGFNSGFKGLIYEYQPKEEV